MEGDAVVEVELETDVHGAQVHLGEERAVLDERAREEILQGEQRQSQVVEAQLTHLLDQNVQIQKRKRL